MLRLIDRLAGWWLDWRTRRAAGASEGWEALKLVKLGINEKYAEAILEHPAIAMMAEDAGGLLKSVGAQNYFQFELFPRIDRGIRPIRVTLQWATGKSPAAMNDELRDKCARLERENVELREHREEF